MRRELLPLALMATLALTGCGEDETESITNETAGDRPAN